MERPKKVAVIDASVATKWFVDEEFTEHALRMVRDYERKKVDLRSVQLLPFEVVNALRYNPKLGEAEVDQAGDALLKFRMALYPLLGDLKEGCLNIAYKYGLTVYDSSYVALSRLLDTELYTADELMLTKTGGRERVRHIGEYPG